jgi:hypothetical protein
MASTMVSIVASIVISKFFHYTVPCKKFTKFFFSVPLHLSMHSCFGNSFLPHRSKDFAPKMKTRCLTVEERTVLLECTKVVRRV